VSVIDAKLNAGRLRFASSLSEAETMKGELLDFRRQLSSAGRSSARSHEKLDIQLKNLRLHLQAGREAAAPRTLRDWWRWLRATG
jgi:hypothetical protein